MKDSMQKAPSDGAGVIGYGTLGLGMFGALLLVIAAFASDRLVSAVQTLLTGWP